MRLCPDKTDTLSVPTLLGYFGHLVLYRDMHRMSDISKYAAFITIESIISDMSELRLMSLPCGQSVQIGHIMKSGKVSRKSEMSDICDIRLPIAYAIG